MYGPTVIGIIACTAIVICGLGCYFIGRMAGMEWVLEHTVIEVVEDDGSGKDQE
jgi:uncharacterized membrane protein YdjX (TVP38/TMEM64 family)